MPVYCYLVECANSAIYSGWTKNLDRRVRQHNSGKGARYTRLNGPVRLVYWETQPDQSQAMKREWEIKKLNHQQKKSFFSKWSILMKTDTTFDPYAYISVAPGRVNLLGEHVDYNGGPVLPAAIDRQVIIGANPRPDQTIRLTAADLDEEVVFNTKSLLERQDINGNPMPYWALYPAGVARTALKRELQVVGLDALFSSTIPIGAGLSSSAAVEVAFAALWRELGSWDIDNLNLALLCQEAENDYVGVNCGLMDQFASANGVKDSALLFDTQTLKWKPIQLPKDVAIIIADSMKRRKLTTSAYNERRDACEKAVSILKNRFPNMNYLADITPHIFEENSHLLPADIRKRAEHVVYECQRVRDAERYLSERNLEAFGQLMTETHYSLRDLYEVSIPELDTLVEIAKMHSGCYGSRLTGAGFGGCSVSIVDLEQADAFIDHLRSQYQNSTGLSPEIYLCTANQGVKVHWKDSKRGK